MTRSIPFSLGRFIKRFFQPPWCQSEACVMRLLIDSGLKKYVWFLLPYPTYFLSLTLKFFCQSYWKMNCSFTKTVTIFRDRSGHSNIITCLTSFFWKKNPVRLQKKKEKKSHLWCLTDESGFEIFCQTPKKKKASDLRRYTSHPSGYRD